MNRHSTRFAMYALVVALLANAFRPEIQSLLYGQSEVAHKGLRIDGDLVLNGRLIVGKGFTLSSVGPVGAVIVCPDLRLDGTLGAKQITASSGAFAEGLTCDAAIAGNSGQFTKGIAADALHVANASVAKNLAVGRTIYVEDIAIRELKSLVEDLAQNQTRPVGEIVERLLRVLQAIHGASTPEPT